MDQYLEQTIINVQTETDQENIFGENKECDMAISYQASPGVECFEIDNK